MDNDDLIVAFLVGVLFVMCLLTLAAAVGGWVGAEVLQ